MCWFLKSIINIFCESFFSTLLPKPPNTRAELVQFVSSLITLKASHEKLKAAFRVFCKWTKVLFVSNVLHQNKLSVPEAWWTSSTHFIPHETISDHTLLTFMSFFHCFEGNVKVYRSASSCECREPPVKTLLYSATSGQKSLQCTSKFKCLSLNINI